MSLSKEIEEKFGRALAIAGGSISPAGAILVLADVIASRMDAAKLPSEADVIREAEKAKEDVHIIKTKGDLWQYLFRVAKDYVRQGVQASLVRNNHMHKAPTTKKEVIGYSTDIAEAILVDFINKVGMDQGLDVGLYTKHLHEDEL